MDYVQLPEPSLLQHQVPLVYIFTAAEVVRARHVARNHHHGVARSRLLTTGVRHARTIRKARSVLALAHVHSHAKHQLVLRARVRHVRHLAPAVRAVGLGGAQEGYASYYISGRFTASGERYNPMATTCAHRTWPFGKIVSVTHLGTGKTITCRVNDRGPFIRGRIIDLSRAGAIALGIIGSGTARVRIE